MSARSLLHRSGRLFAHFDWFLFGSAVTISLLGVATMHSFSAQNDFSERQLIWLCVAIGVCFLASLPNYSFLRRTQVISALYGAVLLLLALIFAFGSIVKGAQTRFDLGFFFVQPADPAKLVLVALLAKYFARRHIEIAHVRHILVSGSYAFALFLLVFLQPDLGSCIAIFSIWFGMVLVSGISWKHVATLLVAGTIVCVGLWFTVLQPYQKARIIAFIHPLADIRGSGYHAYQSTIAVGSGEALGKGIGYGTQSKLQFLPEYQTDFIFASFAEEWGFVGVILFLTLFGIVILRILAVAARGADSRRDLLEPVGAAARERAHEKREREIWKKRGAQEHGQPALNRKTQNVNLANRSGDDS